ncbi:tRNA (adenosine(37)-N6)-threonylcarbamoyltransferase complex ATPase subunit type 1 TsaE [Staphylococcus hominis]|uniref:tRNA (adenosine(37)-N6)-threonylcarbamoyltransferase complex ATPase subunit type 1 TsaE n=1 Tax=Staphylococcus hominis TaxID=1290 RepID=UPI000778BF15|nr:tRNA (adenosine(37)-N6)-threonylcarbamoyltransferase complex ATPase subunit type 1 TsaE [Staphylococcus hominis]OAW27473.1 tRNA (N6-adenosine(37)-N6)-threonylcarbamoyltransferase complex ATPase TsaE [Staphylococcus hominis]
MIPIKNLDEMEQFAKILMKHVGSKDVILLNGDLGAGKTTLTQFIGKYLGVKRNINSPTFNIIKSYKGKELKLHHMDCYRLEDSDEDLGFNEYFEDDAVTIIEWSQFIQEFLPEEYLVINITTINESQRQINIAAKGYHYTKIKEEIDNELTVN